MALHQLTEAELDAVTGGTYVVRQRNVSLQLGANVAIKSNVSTNASASASGFFTSASASATGGQVVAQDSSQANYN